MSFILNLGSSSYATTNYSFKREIAIDHNYHPFHYKLIFLHNSLRNSLFIMIGNVIHATHCNTHLLELLHIGSMV